MDRSHGSARLRAVAIVAMFLVAACNVLPGERPALHLDNGTTLAVTLVVNGQAVASYPAGQGTEPAGFAGPLPPLPWSVAVLSPSGRVLTTMAVQPGDVGSTTSGTAQSFRGTLARVDLSCGRLDLWAGDAPPLGPAPGPGVPGDCAP
jgi:hypothetical protein